MAILSLASARMQALFSVIAFVGMDYSMVFYLWQEGLFKTRISCIKLFADKGFAPAGATRAFRSPWTFGRLWGFNTFVMNNTYCV